MSDQYRGVVDAVVRLFKVLRAGKNSSLESLADLAGIHRTHLSLLERGERQPTLGVAIQLARGLGYELSELLAKAELIESGKLNEGEAFTEALAREKKTTCLRNASRLGVETGLTGDALLDAIQSTYHTLDTIDAELVRNDAVPVAQLVELANLSSMIGNILGAGLAIHSNGLYARNKPHTYPDLLPLTENSKWLELKMALETNKPKAHLAKAGSYMTFRYVLGDQKGKYIRGKESRGNTVWIWEVKAGYLGVDAFDISNTAGDSGKTAVIKTVAFNAMALVYFDAALCPYTLKSGVYPGYN